MFPFKLTFYLVCNGLQLNGRRIVTWNTDSKYEETSDSLYQAHPFILAVLPDGTSYGIIFDSTFKLTLDLSSPTKISAISEPPVPFSVVIIVKSNPMYVFPASSHFSLPSQILFFREV